MANVLKGGSVVMLSFFSSRTTTLSRTSTTTKTHCSFLPKFPFFSLSSSSRPKTPSGFPSYCTLASDPVPEAIAAETNSNGENDKSIKDAAGLLDIRVGRIIRAWKHDEAETLYVEEVDIGEPEPRIICSGLVNYIPLEHLQGKKVIVLSNLKPRNMRGVKSCGMLMAASDSKHENVELLFPPEEANPGERIWFGSKDEKDNQPEAAKPNQIQKKKIWELVQPHLKTDVSCTAMLGEHVMSTSVGTVACQSLQNANIS
ncbi:unnamed protein product [Lathyrus oleraceus]|uniref:tRNA-binding domain-containing protein n=1 Tax=Pisum sativum TaxID=3888 RepID=A0A9D4ZZ58_PEA|nr:uncharacterized protein LOC127105635 [Pisum sativum]XP_050898787.1 uncharacterized protein LOC127105635 [Pisum sativum]XP_050898788.1 uncharacterized protein LOC127105635 [Pisum sativum]KAI5389379.1 hypothetical protein KIW84_074865 [Pisum sativum]